MTRHHHPEPAHWWQSLRPHLKLIGLAFAGTILSLLTFVFALWFWAGGDKVPPGDIAWGLTYSSGAAKGLGLDPRETYRAILDDLHPQRLRLVAYWTDIEPKPGVYDYSDLDYQVSEAEKRGIPYVIAVGRKVPRWPECFIPDWAKQLPQPEQQDRALRIISRTVERYDQNIHLLRWQVENEPYFIFGECPNLDQKFFNHEIDLVRSRSTHQVMVTDSGEASSWLQASDRPDVFGSTLYRVVLNNPGQPFHHFLTPEMYTRHGNLIKKLHPNIKQLVIAELQGEPWSKVGLAGLSQAYIDQTLSHQQFQSNINFARDVGFSEVYLWGAEWWYYRLQNGDSYYWDTARATFTNAPAHSQ